MRFTRGGPTYAGDRSLLGVTLAPHAQDLARLHEPAVWARDGTLVATVVQESLIRPGTSPSEAR